MSNKLYIVIGKDLEFLSLTEFGRFEDKDNAEECLEQNYTKCDGLIQIIEVDLDND